MILNNPIKKIKNEKNNNKYSSHFYLAFVGELSGG